MHDTIVKWSRLSDRAREVLLNTLCLILMNLLFLHPSCLADLSKMAGSRKMRIAEGIFFGNYSLSCQPPAILQKWNDILGECLAVCGCACLRVCICELSVCLGMCLYIRIFSGIKGMECDFQSVAHPRRSNGWNLSLCIIFCDPYAPVRREP